MTGRLDAWRQILAAEFATLLAAIAASDDRGPTLLSRLREDYPRDLVEVAMDLVQARAKAEGKFADPARLLCDVAGVEQATGARVAAHKAARFAPAPRVIDLCCGIGGDAMALAQVVEDVRVVDRSAERVVMACHNAQVRGEVLDLLDFLPGDTPGEASGDAPDDAAWLHVDPSRREESTGRRLWKYADYEPGPDILEPILTAAPAAAVKLGPGVDWAELPRRSARELEFVSDRGTLVSTVMWCGALCRSAGANTATRLGATGTDTITFTAAPDDAVPVDEESGRFLLVPDPALERCHLVAPRIADTTATELAAGLGLLTCDEPLADPWFESWEILAQLPWREAKIRDWLRANDGGHVTVRTRGGAVPTDAMQVALRGGGDTSFTLFGLRLGKRIVCLVTRRAD